MPTSTMINVNLLINLYVYKKISAHINHGTQPQRLTVLTRKAKKSAFILQLQFSTWQPLGPLLKVKLLLGYM